MQTSELPRHVLNLLKVQQREEAERQRKLENERNKCSIRVRHKLLVIVKQFLIAPVK